MHGKARYTLATKSNSTRSTMWKVDKVDRVALALYTLATKSKGRSTFGQQSRTYWRKVNPVGDKVTKLATVDRNKLSNSTLSPVCCQNRQQISDRVDHVVDKVERIGDKVESIGDS